MEPRLKWRRVEVATDEVTLGEIPDDGRHFSVFDYYLHQLETVTSAVGRKPRVLSCHRLNKSSETAAMAVSLSK